MLLRGYHGYIWSVQVEGIGTIHGNVRRRLRPAATAS
jgi:hypothetical protein